MQMLDAPILARLFAGKRKAVSSERLTGDRQVSTIPACRAAMAALRRSETSSFRKRFFR